MNKIYTSYFGMLRSLPSDIIPICITASIPDFYHGLAYDKLKPAWSAVDKYKKTKDEDSYVQYYRSQVLAKLNPNTVLSDLFRLSQGKDIALICYEKSGEFCHRHLVAEWLAANTDIKHIEEFGDKAHDVAELW